MVQADGERLESGRRPWREDGRRAAVLASEAGDRCESDEQNPSGKENGEAAHGRGKPHTARAV
jgi:hypothetical protein